MHTSTSQMLAIHTQLLNEHNQAFTNLQDAVLGVSQHLKISAQSDISTICASSCLQDEAAFSAVHSRALGTDKSIEMRHREGYTRKERQNKPRYRLRLRGWFTNRIWDIALGQAQGGWDIRLRTWNVRPHHSKIFRLCEAGDLEGVQKLMAAGEASVWDTTMYGETVLYVGYY